MDPKHRLSPEPSGRVMIALAGRHEAYSADEEISGQTFLDPFQGAPPQSQASNDPVGWLSSGNLLPFFVVVSQLRPVPRGRFTLTIISDREVTLESAPEAFRRPRRTKPPPRELGGEAHAKSHTLK